MIYDVIIIGAGAAGLFAGASSPSPQKGLIIEKKSVPGRKLLMSGAGQCNLTHNGNIKEFLMHYGKNGTKIRSILYRFNNNSLMNFFESLGIPLFEREDGKVFPKSLSAQEVLNTLLNKCKQNGFEFVYSKAVDNIDFEAESENLSVSESLPALIYTVKCGSDNYKTKKLIIATGGCSYPTTGSDGSFFSVIKNIGIKVNPLAPALVPLFVSDYPYQSLSGISFSGATITAYGKDNKKSSQNKDALLLTHKGFSGPAVLNITRDLAPGDIISINYFPEKQPENVEKELIDIFKSSNKQIITVLYEYFNKNGSNKSAEIPKRFLEVVCLRAGIDCFAKASQITAIQRKEILKIICQDKYSVKNLGGYEIAMVTKGGVSLDEINTKTMESKKFPGLFFVGEVVDIDGDTGGYNLQFAFSSAYAAMNKPE